MRFHAKEFKLPVFLAKRTGCSGGSIADISKKTAQWRSFRISKIKPNIFTIEILADQAAVLRLKRIVARTDNPIAIIV
jgi:hypothetical protein